MATKEFFMNRTIILAAVTTLGFALGAGGKTGSQESGRITEGGEGASDEPTHQGPAEVPAEQAEAEAFDAARDEPEELAVDKRIRASLVAAKDNVG